MAPWVLLLPLLQLVEAIAPVPAAPQQSHHHNPSCQCRGGEVVIQLRRVVERRQRQSSDAVEPGMLRLLTQQMTQGAQIGSCAAEKENLSLGLLHEDDILGGIHTGTTGESMHPAIVEVTGGEKIQRSGPFSNATVPALCLVSGPVRSF